MKKASMCVRGLVYHTCIYIYILYWVDLPCWIQSRHQRLINIRSLRLVGGDFFCWRSINTVYNIYISLLSLFMMLGFIALLWEVTMTIWLLFLCLLTFFCLFFFFFFFFFIYLFIPIDEKTFNSGILQWKKNSIFSRWIFSPYFLEKKFSARG